jgi:hypothetical protein
MSRLVTGDDSDVTVDCLGSDDQPVNLSTATEIKAVLVSIDRTESLTPIYNCLSNSPGADWAIGKVVVLLNGIDTAALENRRCSWEIQAIIGGRKKTFLDEGAVLIVKGRIP